MDQPSSIIFDLIGDPETGLALLAKRPGEETPEQERERQFWQLQFMQWRDWRAGDVLAVARALTDCSLFNEFLPCNEEVARLAEFLSVTERAAKEAGRAYPEIARQNAARCHRPGPGNRCADREATGGRTT
jgi:hypothetical protein